MAEVPVTLLPSLGAAGADGAGEGYSAILSDLGEIGAASTRNAKPLPRMGGPRSEFGLAHRAGLLPHGDSIRRVTHGCQDAKIALDNSNPRVYNNPMNNKPMGSKKCCEEARIELSTAQSIMSSFSPTMPMHADAESRRDLSQAHLDACAKPRRMALAARIVANAGGR